jgi:hypothetical protein
MTSHRNPSFVETGTKMSAYLVIVTNSDDPDTLGIMFDSGTSDARLGCAVFYGQALINAVSTAFLRTSAHELGHQFNLHHLDGTTYVENGVTKFTIMNQTGTIQDSVGGWPAAVSFKFGDHETSHLSNHPDSNVKPGGSNFSTCNTEHQGWHTL